MWQAPLSMPSQSLDSIITVSLQRTILPPAICNLMSKVLERLSELNGVPKNQPTSRHLQSYIKSSGMVIQAQWCEGVLILLLLVLKPGLGAA